MAGYVEVFLWTRCPECAASLNYEPTLTSRYAYAICPRCGRMQVSLYPKGVTPTALNPDGAALTQENLARLSEKSIERRYRAGMPVPKWWKPEDKRLEERGFKVVKGGRNTSR